VQPKKPDALAGKAIALEATGHHEDAITTYKTATDLDPRFRDLKVLQSEFAWSEAARKTAVKRQQPLRRQLDLKISKDLALITHAENAIRRPSVG
jgi:hypothetical protein